MTKDFKVEDLPSYKLAVTVSEFIYEQVKIWAYVDKNTVGVQVIRSADSIAANIAEGFGRYHKKDKIKFFYNARASAIETTHWIKTAYTRKLINKSNFDKILDILEKLPKEINYLIKITNNNLTI